MYENMRQLNSDSEGCHTDMRIGIVGQYGDHSSDNTRVVVHNLAVIKGSFSHFSQIVLTVAKQVPYRDLNGIYEMQAKKQQQQKHSQ